MIAFLRLIRIQNLLIVAGLQYLIRWLVIYPVRVKHEVINSCGLEFDFQVSEFHFFLLVMATVCLTAAGYVINDYFDRKTDLVNRPETVIVGKSIYRRTAMVIHSVLNVAGIAMGVYISWANGLIELSAIYVIIAAVLWFYSTQFKKRILIGNLIVASMTAMVPMLVVIYEIPLLNRNYHESTGCDFNWLANYVLIIGYFAFIVTLVREIIKDIEDMEGDLSYDSRTLPIAVGANGAKVVVYGLIVLIIGSLFCVYYLFEEKYFLISDKRFTLWYISIALLLPMLFLVIKLFKAKDKKEYHFASNLSKIIMLIGIMYLVFKEAVNFIITN